MRQHMKQSHAREYNEELQEVGLSQRKKWTDKEVEDLAQAEAEYEGDDLMAPLTEISGRSYESLRKRRRTPEWRNLVERFETIQRTIIEENNEGELDERLNQMEEFYNEALREPELVEEVNIDF
ncbi:hypothetical protein HHI36_000220 [Cryptolaemus montrouzieri]|uniref:Uncharacterized protein n=1 Tax=Cryptolaemus montrouzieri TaxID=559131 RepID=A0ABD2P3Y7_9CUCU